MRIFPSLRAWLVWALIVYGALYVFVSGLVAVWCLYRGEPLPADWFPPWIPLLIIVFGSTTAALLLYVITWFGRAVITSEHLSATTFWGRRRELPWPSIGKVTAMRLAGIPFLFVRSPQANVFVYLLGVDRDRIRARLSEVAGTQHPVTVAVSPGAAS